MSETVVEETELRMTDVLPASNMTKIDAKRAQIYQERRRRLLNRGVPEAQVDATLAAEDYRNLPLAERFARFEKMALGALEGLQRDIMSLRHNDSVIAESMDINLRAMSMCLEKAGVSKEAQSDIIKQVDGQLREERAQQAAALEQKTIETEVDTEGQAEVPEGATVFGS